MSENNTNDYTLLKVIILWKLLGDTHANFKTGDFDFKTGNFDFKTKNFNFKTGNFNFKTQNSYFKKD